MGVSKSSIKSKVKDIQDLLDRKVSIENIVQLLAIAPMSARTLPDVPHDKLPSGGVNEAAENIIELGPDEGMRYVADLEGRPTVKCIGHDYNKAKEKLLLKLRTNDRESGKTYDSDLVVSNVGEIEAEWMIAKMGRRRVT